MARESLQIKHGSLPPPPVKAFSVVRPLAFFPRLFFTRMSNVQVPGKPLAARPQGLDAAAAHWAPCLPRTGGPQLAARRCQLQAAGA